MGHEQSGHTPERILSPVGTQACNERAEDRVAEEPESCSSGVLVGRKGGGHSF